jgi:uncharacterized protein (DUF362 family)
MKPIVCTRRCAIDTPDHRIRETLFEMLDGLDGLASSLASVRRIAVKSNLGILDVRWHKGRQVALADPVVVEGTVAWLRAHTDAEIIVGDASTGVRCEEVAQALGLPERLAPYHARIVDFKDGAYTTFTVPGGGLMFNTYVMTEEMALADVVVSIAKMKSHLGAGVTLTLKNLFGIPPTSVYGSPRRYLHAPIRLPRVIADLGLILKPTLCVIDGLVGQTQQEWNGGPVETNWLIAGNNTVATDAVGMTIMGVNPAGDYPDPPFHFDRNPVRLAADRGLGPLSMREIDLRGDSLQQADGYYADKHSEARILDEIRFSIAEQAALFNDHRDDYLRKFAGQFIGLYDGKVIYTGTDLDNLTSRGQIAREHGGANRGLYLKKVVPLEEELERYEVYHNLLHGARV